MTRDKQKPSAAIMFADEDTREVSTKPVLEEEYVDESPVADELPNIGGDSIVTLPSNGVMGYPATFEYRDILVKDEEVLATVTAQNYNRTLNGVLKSLVKDNPEFTKMSIHDRDYLLVYLWSNNYSPVKKVSVTCAHCEAKEDHTVDMTEIEVSHPKDNFKQPLKVPMSQGDKEGAFFRVYMSTVEHEMIVEEYMQNSKTNKMPFEQLMMIASIDVGMPVPFEKKIEWVKENVTGKEMGYVRRYHEYFRFGLKDTIDYKCGSCSEVTTGVLPFQISDILNPSVSDDFEEFLSAN